MPLVVAVIGLALFLTSPFVLSPGAPLELWDCIGIALALGGSVAVLTS